MTTLISGLNALIRGWFAAANGRLYFANGFDAVRVMTPDVGYTAGIVGPVGAIGAVSSTAAGTIVAGNHLIRYRYKDSRTGYVSNPSDALEVNVTGGAQSLTFNISGGGPIVASADAKVDTILVEMTPVNAANYYQAASALNAAASVTVNLTDQQLINQINSDAEYGSARTFDLFSHEPPPALAVMAVQRGRAFYGVDCVYTTGVSNYTNGSPTVTGTGFSVKWAGRLLQRTGDTASYEILSATTTVITLTTNYGGSTAALTGKVYLKLPNRIYYSRPGYPEETFPAQWARDVLAGKGDRLVAMWPRRDALYLLGQYSSERLAFVTDPGAATSNILPIEGMRGVFNQRCLVEADGKLYAADRQGIYIVQEIPKQISQPIDEVLRELVDYDQAIQFHGGFEPIDRLLCFRYVGSGDGTPKWVAIYEIDTGRWWLDKTLTGQTASAVIPSTDGQVRLWTGDENGYLWATSIAGSFDGVPPGCPSVVTVDGGSTSTVIQVDETLTTSPGLAGATLTDPDTEETRIISSNTATSITVSPALTFTPVTGQSFYLGAIPWQYRTKWFVGSGELAAKKRGLYFLVQIVPGTGTGTMRVYFFKDFDSNAPMVFTAFPDDTPPNGVTIVDGLDYCTIDLALADTGGCLAVPIPDTWQRSLQAELTSLVPSTDIRILNLQFVTDEKPVVGE